jgi:uncharacterized membrane protein
MGIDMMKFVMRPIAIMRHPFAGGWSHGVVCRPAGERFCVMKRLLLLATVLACVFGSRRGLPARADEPVVRAVLFYSPSCGHCHYVITETLPPLFEKYPGQLQIVGANVTEAGGQALYQAAVKQFDIPPERLGVPTLVVADVVLVGSIEIPEQFPVLIERYLAQGGAEWPDLPGLAESLAQPTAGPTPEPTTGSTTPTPGTSPLAATPAASRVAPATGTSTNGVPVSATGSSSPGLTPTAAAMGLVLNSEPPANLAARLAHDPAGNTLAIVALAGMLYAVGRVSMGTWSRRTSGLPQRAWRGWLLPGLTVAGMAVAGYLAYVELAHVEATCGPVGDCNTVQQSQYARLFGVLPIGVLGLVGYAAILLAWLVARFTRGRLAELTLAGLWGMTLLGTLFSMYLTFLEPFVIGATCAWCLTSAAIITLMLWITAAPGRDALARSLG